jgi:hypothetical protein
MPVPTFCIFYFLFVCSFNGYVTLCPDTVTATEMTCCGMLLRGQESSRSVIAGCEGTF